MKDYQISFDLLSGYLALLPLAMTLNYYNPPKLPMMK